MGNFYVNFSVKGADQRQVVEALERAGRRAIVTPPQGEYIVAYDEEADSQAMEPIQEVGGFLSRELARPVLAVLNHDDDILCYWLFEAGELTDTYNSNPGAFEDEEGTPPWQAEGAGKLCAVLRPDADAAALGGDYVFAVDRHEQLAQALGLPPWSVGFGYRYVDEGELDDEAGADRLVRVGDKTA